MQTWNWEGNFNIATHVKGVARHYPTCLTWISTREYKLWRIYVSYSRNHWSVISQINLFPLLKNKICKSTNKVLCFSKVIQRMILKCDYLAQKLSPCLVIELQLIGEIICMVSGQHSLGGYTTNKSWEDTLFDHEKWFRRPTSLILSNGKCFPPKDVCMSWVQVQ